MEGNRSSGNGRALALDAIDLRSSVKRWTRPGLDVCSGSVATARDCRPSARCGHDGQRRLAEVASWLIRADFGVGAPVVITIHPAMIGVRVRGVASVRAGGGARDGPVSAPVLVSCWSRVGDCVGPRWTPCGTRVGDTEHGRRRAIQRIETTWFLH